MKMMFSSSRLFLFFVALALLALVSFPSRADAKDAVEKKMTSLNDAHREMFGTGDFAKLDEEMNKIQAGYEKGRWTDNEVWILFSVPFAANDPAFEDLYNKWVTAYPKSYAAHFSRAAYCLRVAWTYVGKPDKAADAKRLLAAALQDYTASLSLTAKPLMTYCNLMGLYGLTRDNDKVRTTFDAAVQLDSGDVLARTAYMDVLSRTGTLAEMQKLADDMRKTGRDEDDMSIALKTFYTRLFRESRYGDLDREMNRVQKNYEAGKVDDETLDGYFGIFRSTDAREEQGLDAWIKAYPKSYAAWQARCTYFLDVAWAARGSHYIKDMSGKELQGMALYLKRANEDCRAAEALAQKPILAYRDLMTIAQMGGTNETRKQLLDLAHVADPGNIVVRVQYMFGLQPHWGGSLRQMEDFLAQAKLEGVSEHGLTRLNRFILDAFECDYCNGTEGFSKMGTVITGF